MSSIQKRVLCLLSLALALLAAGQILHTFQTIRAFRQTKSEPAATLEPKAVLLTGTVIRQERLIYAERVADWQCCLRAGQRAAVGEILFSTGDRAETWQAAKQSAAARQSLALEQQPLPQRRKQLFAAIGDYNRTTSSDVTLTALLLAEGNMGQTILAETEGNLSGAAAGQMCVLSAPVSGVFVPTVDGLETVLTPEHPVTDTADLPKNQPSVLAMGRLITSDTWYFSAKSTFALKAGDTLDAELLGGEFGSCTLTVERAEQSGGMFSLLFSCSENVDAVAGIRTLTIKLSNY